MIAWDLDNTLVNRDQAVHAFFAAWVKQRFGRPDIARLLALICLADRSGDGDRLEFCRQVLEVCGQPSSGAAWLWDKLQRELPSLFKLVPRVARLLDSLHPKYRMVVATNGGSAFQRAKICHASLNRWFDDRHVFVSGELGAAKPDPVFFEATLETTSIPPAEVLFVGDHLRNDIGGAASCGMQTCWVSLGRKSPDLPPADFTVERVWNLERALSFPAISLV